ncbi:MAG: hypothetical protein U1E29_06695 [Coriobacteriia bacterium]|nr:hypothetical protein [Coriobacteriia bacterium]
MEDPTGTPTAPPAPPAPTPSGMGANRPGPVNDTSKLLAALGYIFWIVALIAILIEPYKEEKFVKFHAFQALAFGIGLWLLAAVTTPIFGLGALVGIAGFFYSVFLAIKTFGGEYIEVPIVYGLVKGYVGE